MQAEGGGGGGGESGGVQGREAVVEAVDDREVSYVFSIYLFSILTLYQHRWRWCVSVCFRRCLSA